MKKSKVYYKIYLEYFFISSIFTGCTNGLGQCTVVNSKFPQQKDRSHCECKMVAVSRHEGSMKNRSNPRIILMSLLTLLSSLNVGINRWSKQWAAVSICFSFIIEPPQWCLYSSDVVFFIQSAADQGAWKIKIKID